MARLRGKLTMKQVNDRIDEATKHLDDEKLTDVGEKDTTSMGHVALDQQRRILHYMRLIENEMPQLVGASAVPARVELHLTPLQHTGSRSFPHHPPRIPSNDPSYPFKICHRLVSRITL